MKQRSKSTEILFQTKTFKKCVFCDKLKQSSARSFCLLLIKALYAKYSSSQNYYYSKLITDILENESTEQVVHYRDLETQNEDEEYLKRFYIKKEVKAKENALLEYYKYHRDIPRLFMKPSYHTIYRFHEKKRRIEYGRIKRQLGIQEEVKEETELEDEKKHRKQTSQDCSVRQLKNLLQGINLEESSYLQIKNEQQPSQSLSQLKDIIQLLHEETPIKQQLFKSSLASEQIQKLLMKQKSSSKKQIVPAAPEVKKIELPIKLAEDLRRNKQITAPKSVAVNEFKPCVFIVDRTVSNSPFKQAGIVEMLIKAIFRGKGKNGSNQHFNVNELEQFLQNKESFKRAGQRSSLHTNSNKGQVQQKSGHLKQLSLGQNTFQQQIQTLKNLYQQQTIPVKDYRTKSSDHLVSPPSRPNSSNQKNKQDKFSQVKFTNNVYLQGQKKQPQIYTINQNNVVNIYLDDIKKSFKSVSLTSRGQSPQKFGTRKIFNCDQQLAPNAKITNPFALLKKK